MSAINIGNITNAIFKVGSGDCTVYLGNTKLYPQEEPTQDYFTMVVTNGGDIKWSGSTTENTLSYSKDNGETWTTVTSADTITVAEGDRVLWKGTPTPQSSYPKYGIGKFSGDTNARYSVEGNAMSLLFGDDFNGQTSLEGKNYALKDLFSNNKNVTSAENMSLPATTLADGCYSNMFGGCTSLTTAPSMLQATTLASYCYGNMFYGCTSLTAAPDLPATTLSEWCYDHMFYGCTSLTAAPELPATTLERNCYGNMFASCTSLTTAPELLATTLANACYYMMFSSCTSLTTAPSVLPATTLTNQCYDGMFSSCTSLTAAPELPATTLQGGCYRNMFWNCPKLNSIKCLATDISAYECTLYWVTSVASSGTFTKASSMSSWTTGASGIPNGWTVVDA